MAKSLLLVLAFTILEVQSAVLRNEDGPLARIARSPCYVCQQQLGAAPLGPPPPPFFRSQNWSGYTSSSDGRQQGVFSGASAAASSNDHRASGQAFSLAASGASNNGQGSYQDQSATDFNENQKAQQLQRTESNHGYPSTSYGHTTDTQFLANQDNQQHLSHTGVFSYGGNAIVKEGRSNEFTANDQKQYLSNEYVANAHNSAKSQAGAAEQHKNYRGDIGQVQTKYNQQDQWQKPGYERGEYENGGSGHASVQIQQQKPSALREDIGQVQTKHNQQEQWQKPGYRKGEFQNGVTGQGSVQSASYSKSHSGVSYNNPAGLEQPSALRGDIGQVQTKYNQQDQWQIPRHGRGEFENSIIGQRSVQSSSNSKSQSGGPVETDQQKLAIRGNNRQIQTNNNQEQWQRPGYAREFEDVATGQESAQSALGGALTLASQGLQTAQQSPCSSCGKSSYAISNANSHSGSAIALSIGG